MWRSCRLVHQRRRIARRRRTRRRHCSEGLRGGRPHDLWRARRRQGDRSTNRGGNVRSCRRDGHGARVTVVLGPALGVIVVFRLLMKRVRLDGRHPQGATNIGMANDGPPSRVPDDFGTRTVIVVQVRLARVGDDALPGRVDPERDFPLAWTVRHVAIVVGRAHARDVAFVLHRAVAVHRQECEIAREEERFRRVEHLSGPRKIRDRLKHGSRDVQSQTLAATMMKRDEDGPSA